MAELAYQMMSILDETNGDIIYDPTTIDWMSYDWSQGYFIHKISSNEIITPYMISYTYYASIDYEDIILWLNNISDVWDLVPGSELWIPYVENLKQFISLSIKY